MIEIESEGSFDRTDSFLNRLLRRDILTVLNRYGEQGVVALSNATPVRTGLTADSWYYETFKSGDSYSIVWKNSNVVAGRPVVILLQYGHGTGTGGYVKGYDFINPAIRPIFDKIADSVWREVTSA